MRRHLTRLLHAPALWYALLCWLLLVLSVVLPSAWRLWTTGLPSGLFYGDSSAAPWAVIGVTIAVGTLAAWHRGRIVDAIIAVTCATLAFWVVDWAAIMLPVALTPTSHPVTEAQEQSYYVDGAITILFVFALFVFAPGGAILGGIGGLIGWGMHQLERRLRRSPLDA